MAEEKDRQAAPSSASRTFWRWAITVSGWVVAAAVWTLDAPAKINSFSEEAPQAMSSLGDAMFLDKGLTGTWAVEGIVDLDDEDQRLAFQPRGPVAIDMKVYRGKVSGEIWSRGLEENYVYSIITIEGIRRDEIIEGVAFDFIGGKRTALATFRISRDRAKDAIVLKVLSQRGPYFPPSIRLYKMPGAMPEGRLNTDIIMDALQAKPGTVPKS